MVVAHELGLVDRDRDGCGRWWQMDRVNEGLLADNPVGKIPTLVLDDGTAIYDSLTICEYLDSRVAGTRLFPAAAAGAVDAALTWHALGSGAARTR